MTRVIIICEGQTEQSFCNEVLNSYLNNKQIYIQPIITGRGIVKWEVLKDLITKHLKQDENIVVTTLIDYYGIPSKFNYPNWQESLKLLNIDKYQAKSKVEQGMLNDIEESLKERFIPYIQLHEFESLLFSDIDVFTNYFEDSEFADYKYLEETITNFGNPEDINNSPQTAPSKRLDRIIKGYDKVVYGSLLAEEIGLDTIREKCIGFNDWICKIENLNE